MTTAYEKIMSRNRQSIEVTDDKVLKEWKDSKSAPKMTYIKNGKLFWKNQMDVVGTPEGFKWFYQRFVKDFDETTDLLVKASTYQNKHLPDGYIENLEQQFPPNLAKAYLSGEFINLNSENVYQYFDRKIHHRDIEVEKHEVIHCGVDFNIGGCAVSCFVIRGGIPNMFGEFRAKDTYGIVDGLKDRFDDRQVCVYPDASAKQQSTNATKTDLEILRKGGFTIYSSSKNPRVQDRINSVNALFSHNRFFIDINKCPQTAESLEQQAYDPNGVPEKYAGAYTVDDKNDCVGYFIHYKFPLIARGVSKGIMKI